MHALLPLLFLAATPAPRCELVEHGFGPKGTVPVRAEVVASGLEVPWGIAFLPDGDWLITERPGRVRRFSKGALDPEPVVKLDVGDSAEGGLLGVAVDPAFARTHAFFLYVTIAAGGRTENQIQRWVLENGKGRLERVLIDHIPAARFHDGGRLRIGPDGMLWAGTGDGRVPDNAQDPASLSGKLLRIAPDGSIPKDNPFPDSPVYLLGVRNTEAFDWFTPRLVVLADHGPSGEYKGRTGHDEIDVAGAGENLGWPTIYSCEEKPGMVTPLLSWTEAAPPGGAVLYRGSAIPEWKNSLIVGTLGSKHLARVAFDPRNPHRVLSHEVYFEGDRPAGFGRLREVVVAPDGQLYVTTSNCDGRNVCPQEKDVILRITREPGRAPGHHEPHQRAR
jgi:glucose/arabinose dehydrogenase